MEKVSNLVLQSELFPQQFDFNDKLLPVLECMVSPSNVFSRLGQPEIGNITPISLPRNFRQYRSENIFESQGTGFRWFHGCHILVNQQVSSQYEQTETL